ncbi:hypothetical protein ACWCP6_15380 [Streptomyces sp. NPDC002004]
MRTSALALRAAVVAVVLAAAPVAAAHAVGGGTVTANPSAARPGAEVDLNVSGCHGAGGRADSDAFVAPADLAPSGGAAPPAAAAPTAGLPTLVAQARVRSSIAPGDHAITVTCEDTRITGTLHVVDPARPAPSPTAPVSAGGGGTAPISVAGERAEDNGPGAVQTVTGLVLAGVAATVVAFRSARRRRPPGAH